MAKMQKLARGGPEAVTATEPGQVLGIDYGFMFGRSKNEIRNERLVGLTGCSAYVTIIDAYRGMIVGCPTTNKTPPILYLNTVLT